MDMKVEMAESHNSFAATPEETDDSRGQDHCYHPGEEYAAKDPRSSYGQNQRPKMVQLQGRESRQNYRCEKAQEVCSHQGSQGAADVSNGWSAAKAPG